jgi:hypothetical protein
LFATQGSPFTLRQNTPPQPKSESAIYSHQRMMPNIFQTSASEQQACRTGLGRF